MHRHLGYILLIATLAASGCRDESAAPPNAVFRAALLTSGPVSDQGWYAGAYEGLLLIEDSLAAEVSHQQTRTPASSPSSRARGSSHA